MHQDASEARIIVAALGRARGRSARIHVIVPIVRHAVAAGDDERGTPISLMTSVNDFELFHTISGGLRYRRQLMRSYDKTSSAPFALWKDALSRAAFYRADPRFRVLAALVEQRRSRLCPRGPERM